MKKVYSPIQIEIIPFVAQDVIMASGNGFYGGDDIFGKSIFDE